jgi:hypothetical protein
MLVAPYPMMQKPSWACMFSAGEPQWLAAAAYSRNGGYSELIDVGSTQLHGAGLLSCCFDVGGVPCMRHAGCTIPCDAEAQLGMHVLCKQTADLNGMPADVCGRRSFMPACKEGCRV